MRIRVATILFWAFALSGRAQFPPLPDSPDSLEAMLVRGGLDDTTLCRVHVNLCADYNNVDLDRALVHGEEAVRIAERLGLPMLEAKAMNNLGMSRMQQARYGEALELLQRSFEIKDSLGDKALAASTLTIIEDLYYHQAMFDKGLRAAQRALKVLGSTNAPRVLAAIHNSLADAYRGLADLDSSSAHYVRALTIAEENGLATEYGAAANGLGMNLFDKKDFVRSAAYYEMSLDLARQIGRADAEGISQMNAGTAYGMAGQVEKGERYLREAMLIADSLDNIYLKYQCLNSLAGILGNAGRYEQAYDNQALLQALGDTIRHRENRDLVAEYETRFETREKEKEIEVLGLEKQVQAEALDKERLRRNVLIGGLVAVLAFAVVVFLQRNRIRREKQRSEELLLNILPEETAEELKATGSAEARLFDEVTVLFTDFKDFTQVAETMTPKDLVAEIDHCFKAFDAITEKHGIEKIKTIGDAYMAAGGLPVASRTNAVDVVHAALEIQAFIKAYRDDRMAQGRPGFDIRIGIHSGPVVAGIVGIKKFAYDIWGDTVNTASRMESSGEPGKVNISGSTYERVKGRFICTHRGKVEAKHKGEIDMYFVEGVMQGVPDASTP